MPDIVGAGGGLTQNGTWLVGGGYFGFWKNNTIRYRGVLGYADVNLKYYGTGGDYLAENPISFSLGAFVTLQQAMFRIGKSNFWLCMDEIIEYFSNVVMLTRLSFLLLWIT